jgi:hypothetical protein
MFKRHRWAAITGAVVNVSIALTNLSISFNDEHNSLLHLLPRNVYNQFAPSVRMAAIPSEIITTPIIVSAFLTCAQAAEGGGPSQKASDTCSSAIFLAFALAAAAVAFEGALIGYLVKSSGKTVVRIFRKEQVAVISDR